MKPSVSVIIPTHDRAPLLPRALDSVLAQTEQPREVIVVDDGSTDDTASLLQNRYPTVAYLSQANKGVSAARNLGIRHAKGQWLAFLDSDDSWMADKLHRQLTALAESPHLLCHTDELWIRDGKPLKQLKKHRKFGGWIYLRCLPLCVISPSSALVHRDLFDEVGLFDEDLPACEDYDLWLRICARHPVLFLPEPLITKYGGHQDQLSRRFVAMDRFRIEALQKILRRGQLDVQQWDATQSMLLRKIDIYVNGATKRGKIAQAAEYRALRERWMRAERGNFCEH